MKCPNLIDFVFPYIEKLKPCEAANEQKSLRDDLEAIERVDLSWNEERALDEAQKSYCAEMERVRIAEGKANTFLAVLAALVPVIIALQAANWEKKAGPAPEALRLTILAIAIVYVAAAGYHAFRTLKVGTFQRVGEVELVRAWKTQKPLEKLARSTLIATRNSRKAVNSNVTYIKVTHQHLLRAFGAFICLLMLDPLFYGMGFRSPSKAPEPPKATKLPPERKKATVLASPPQPSMPQQQSSANAISKEAAPMNTVIDATATISFACRSINGTEICLKQK